MVQSKLIRVKDEGTDMVFLVVKFEPEDVELLRVKGWEFSSRLCVIAAITDTIQASMASFSHPVYDIEERSKILEADHTTISLAEVIRDTPFEQIKDEIDVTCHEPAGWPFDPCPG